MFVLVGFVFWFPLREGACVPCRVFVFLAGFVFLFECLCLLSVLLRGGSTSWGLLYSFLGVSAPCWVFVLVVGLAFWVSTP